MRATVSYRNKRHLLVRAFNRSGRLLGDMHVPWTDLDEGRLMAAAKRWAGYDDFGPEHFREPLRVLLEAARSEAPLTYSGRTIARVVTIFGLVTRLSMQRETAKHPEIATQPVRRPLIVVGAPRTGTTLLHRLLALDPGARPLIVREALAPAPMGIGRLRVDLRRLIAAYTVGMNKGILAPDSGAMHTYTHNGTAECTTLLWPSFVFPMTMVLPSVHDWYMRADDSVYDHAYGMYRLAPDGRIARIRYVLPRHKAASWVGPGRTRKSTRPGTSGVVELAPFEFLDRLADLVPPPRKHRHRYHGVFAANHRLRRAVTALAIGNIGKPGDAATGGQAGAGRAAGGCCDANHANQKPRSSARESLPKCHWPGYPLTMMRTW
ncbi:MAG: sulfotransferase [Planctomycetota bacterium]